MSTTSNSNNKSLFIKGLSDHITQQDLRDLFSRYGKVTDIYIPVSYHNGRRRGFAYVAFEFLDEARRAVRKLDGTFFRGREIKVEHAQGEKKTPQEMRAKEGNDRRSDQGMNGSGGGRIRERRRSWSRDRSRPGNESRRRDFDDGRRRDRSRSPRIRRRSPSPVMSSSRPVHHHQHHSSNSSRDHSDYRREEEREERHKYSSTTSSRRRDDDRHRHVSDGGGDRRSMSRD